MKPRRHSLFTCTRRVRRRGLELKPRVLSELGTSAAGATESSARWPTTLVACTLAVDERTRAAPVKPVKSRLLTRYNAAAVVLQATHAEEAYGPRLQFLSRVVGCSADVRLRAKERPRCAGSLSLRSLDVERHRGSPRRLSTEVFAVPPHNLNRRPQYATALFPSRHSAMIRSVLTTDRDRIARPHSARKRVVPDSTDTESSPEGLSGSKAHRFAGHSPKARGGFAPIDWTSPNQSPRRAQSSKVLCPPPGTIHATLTRVSASDQAVEARQRA